MGWYLLFRIIICRKYAALCVFFYWRHYFSVVFSSFVLLLKWFYWKPYLLEILLLFNKRPKTFFIEIYRLFPFSVTLILQNNIKKPLKTTRKTGLIIGTNWLQWRISKWGIRKSSGKVRNIRQKCDSNSEECTKLSVEKLSKRTTKRKIQKKKKALITRKRKKYK